MPSSEKASPRSQTEEVEPLTTTPSPSRKPGTGPAQPGETTTLMLSLKKDQSAAGVTSKTSSPEGAAGKSLTAAQLRSEEGEPSGRSSTDFSRPTQSQKSKATTATTSGSEPHPSSRPSASVVSEVDDEPVPETPAAKGKPDELTLPPKLRQPQQLPAATLGSKNPQSSGADVLAFPETGDQAALATPSAAKKRRQPDDQEVVPTHTRLVKSKQQPVRRPVSPSGGFVLDQLPRPDLKIEDSTLVPILKARADTIIDEVFAISQDCFRIPEVRDGVSGLLSEAYRGNVTGFREVLDGLRTVLDRPELGGQESES